MIEITQLASARLAKAKAGYTTRSVDVNAIATILTGDIKPESGDLVLVRVDAIGQHERIDQVDGRKAIIFIGDELVLCYGNRYAPDQFEAEIPPDLSPCNLAAAGGIAAKVLSKNAKVKLPTTITPIGLLGDQQGKRLNLADWALPTTEYIGQRPCTIAVVGTSMNAGKTTTAAHLINGFANSGLKVGAAKITGTGAGNDTWLMQDAGARVVLDFTCVGYPSTYRATPKQVEEIFVTLNNHLAAQNVDVIVLEIADGLFQEETSTLVSSTIFRQTVDGVLFAAGGSLGAYAGVEWLQKQNIPVVGISGLVTASPLASREVLQMTSLPVLDLPMLKTEAMNILASAKKAEHPPLIFSSSLFVPPTILTAQD
ncbi:molybdopterin-guanine dinucleotide biosynthesis protein MobB [Calothrix sp. FACHB-1219]|uniref:molybdopterin-guanine dinucleotide biosynthesis protein MobB n=1 Tax=unclassified Calothrix TaxID=2619626 RepID=UPI0016833004|nr:MULTISPECIES: molybdopterin-guanine dinucleotide biosynthesis protein MobB [unclassified Calothrix]MBD2204965.1 molybdopterin-guanine dinucleotide biosynthesis protein MobB [Calothrix sp. FACHB-168]MBD2216211.1 molybdopterin-guanine dinucleotide biosynthesis protein MobB [Calothrix sp. FACHB-1219]